MNSNANAKSRRHFAPETKWQILKEGRSANLPVSQVCDHHQISPTLFYQWERTAVLRHCSGAARSKLCKVNRAAARNSGQPKKNSSPKCNACAR